LGKNFNLRRNKPKKLIDISGLITTFEYNQYGAMIRETNPYNQVSFLNGNILSKTGIGNYSYDDTKKNAVVAVQNFSQTISPQTQNITYTDFDRVSSINENDYELNFVYDTELDRIKTELKHEDQIIETKYFLGSYEKIVTNTNGVLSEVEVHYLPTGSMAYVVENGVPNYYYLYKDYLGSVVAVTNDAGAVVARQSFDAWGRQTNPQNGSYTFTPHTLKWLRGYTSHEHLNEFDLINMNNRLYDPKLARMLAVDNFVQDATSTQAFNRYSYAWNNPLTYTDPDGDLIGTAIIIGAAFGVYSGIKYGKSQGLSGKDLVAYGFVGGIIGGFAGLAGGVISSAGGIMANTAGIMVSSGVNSVGQFGLTGGQSDLTVSAGAVSYNFNEKEFGYMGKSGNSRAENWGYLFGSLANIQDLFAGVDGGSVTVYARKKLAGHSWTEGKDVNISVGPLVDNDPTLSGLKWELTYVKKPSVLDNFKAAHNSPLSPVSNKLNNININKLQTFTKNLNNRLTLSGNKTGMYGLMNGCVNYNSRALFRAGVLNINAFLPVTAPLLLNLELTVRQMGIYASPFLINQ
jgi:RHS repeat-associated protein